MKEKIVSNIFYSLIEKGGLIAASFFVSLLLIRYLPREDYGVIGIVAGYYTFAQLFNLALENVLLRDHKNFGDRLPTVLFSFSLFNLFKTFLLFIFSLGLIFLLPAIYQSTHFIFAILSSFLVLMTDSLISPLIILASARFEQKLVTKMNLARLLMGLGLLIGLIYYPSLQFVLFKDLLVSLVTLTLWYKLAEKFLGRKVSSLKFKEHFDLKLIKETFWGYSLWVHLVGVVTNFMYKADAFFLSFFVSLSAVGDYTIALTSANIANILPSILGYQNSVALSHFKEKHDRERVTHAFLRFNFYLAILSMLAFILLGHFYLWIMTGLWNQDHIYFYLCFIVAGLLLAKTVLSPLVAFINICGDVRSLFWRVNVPIFFVSAISYWVSSKFWGGKGVALANLSNACIWCVLVLIEIKRYQFSFEGLFSWKEDFQKLSRMMKWTKDS